jgi:chromosome partitioning protein
LIDFDVQSNLTVSLGYQNTHSFYEVLQGDRNNLSEMIIDTRYENLWLLPSNENMVLLNKKYFGVTNFEYILKDRLNLIKKQYDYIIIDTPPSIEFFTLNALTASRLAIIPSQCEYLSAHGVNRVVKIIDLVKGKTNPGLDYRILITMYDGTSASSKMIYTKLKERHKGKTFHTKIDFDVKVKESQIMSLPVACYSRQSQAGTQYLNLAREILGGWKHVRI